MPSVHAECLVVMVTTGLKGKLWWWGERLGSNGASGLGSAVPRASKGEGWFW